MLREKLQEIFQEPGCGVNQSKSDSDRKKGCSKQLTPGAAAGGCAFDGAKIILQPITNAVHLVHGPSACEGNSWDNRGSKSNGSLQYRTGFTTDMTELDVIYGGEKRLYQAIKEIADKYHPPAIFVYQTCVPALIGDDVEAVCETARKNFNIPVIPVNAPGYVGSKNMGNKLAGEALLDYVIGTDEPEYTTDLDIALIGEYNIAGELWQVEPLFKKLGIRILSCVSGNAKFKEVAYAHRAKVSMLVCSKAMVNVARKMQDKYFIPFFEGSFYGITDTSEAIRTFAKMLVEQGAKSDLIERAEKLIQEEEKNAWEKMKYYSDRLRGIRLLLITGGVKSWSVVSALTEVGIEIVGTSTKKSTKEDKEKIVGILGEEASIYEELNQKDMFKILRDEKIDIMLSGGRTQFIALKAIIPWLDINQERHHAYAGYDGMIEMVKQIDLAINNPIWKQLRKKAPWEEVSS